MLIYPREGDNSCIAFLECYFGTGAYNETIFRAGHVPGGTIVLSQERTKRSRMIPSFRKKRTLRTRSEKY